MNDYFEGIIWALLPHKILIWFVSRSLSKVHLILHQGPLWHMIKFVGVDVQMWRKENLQDLSPVTSWLVSLGVPLGLANKNVYIKQSGKGKSWGITFCAY